MVSRALCLIALASVGLAACEQHRTALELRVLDAGDACESDSECDDGLVCSGLERCLDGRCWSGRPPACDDGDPCTSNSCVEPLGCEFRLLTSAVCLGENNNTDAGVAEDAGPTSGFVPRFPEYCAQGLVNGDVLVSTQTSLDALQGVRCIDGDLRVLGPEVYSLTALAHLRFVAGDLVVRATTSLKTLDGLESLEKVERHLIVEGMPGVSYQAPFRQLTSVGGDLKLSQIAALQELAGFSALTRVGGHLQLAELLQLSELSDAFSALRWVGGDVSLKSSPKLTHFDGLNALTFVGGSVTMGSETMTRLTGFEGLETVVGALVLSGALTTLGEFARLIEVGNLALTLPALREYEGFQNLTSAFGLSLIAPQLTHLRAFARLRLAGHLGLNLPELQELTGLSKLERTRDLTLKNTGLLRWPFTSLTTAEIVTLEDNPRLYDVDGLKSLTSFTRLIVRNNPSLQSLAALKGPADLYLVFIEGNLNLYDAGLSNLKNIETGLFVRANPNFSRCEADRLVRLYRGAPANLAISSNLGCAQCNGRSCATAPSVADGQSTHLTNLPPNPDMRSLRNVQTVSSFSLTDYVGETVPLPNLTRVGNVSLWNTSLRDLTLLSNLEEVTGNVDITANKQLESLSGMTNLRTVGGTFNVRENPKLSALGLDALESIGGAISFRDDGALSVCQVHALENQLSGAPKASIYRLRPCSGACVDEVCQ